jgi:hypothetical protein
MLGLDPSTGILTPVVDFSRIFQSFARRQMLGSSPSMTLRGQRFAKMRSAETA